MMPAGKLTRVVLGWCMVEVRERRSETETLESEEPQTKESVFWLHHH